MFCTKCGAQIKEGGKFCPKCGAPLRETPPEKKKFGSAPVIVLLVLLIVLALAGIGGVSYFLFHSDGQDFRVEVDEDDDYETKSEDGAEAEIEDDAEEAKESDGEEMSRENAVVEDEAIDEDHNMRDADYILDYSAEYELTEKDLEGLTPEQLRIARNEIYARHGRRFLDEELNEWFCSKEWYLELPEKYSPEEFDSLSPNPLSELERKNAAFISEYEKKIEEMAD